MSGYRRSTATATGTELPPAQRRSRPDRRRAELAVRHAQAPTDTERAVCAFDYVRGAAHRRHPRPDAASEVINNTTALLIAAGDQLLRMQADEPLHRRGNPT